MYKPTSKLIPTDYHPLLTVPLDLFSIRDYPWKSSLLSYCIVCPCQRFPITRSASGFWDFVYVLHVCLLWFMSCLHPCYVIGCLHRVLSGVSAIFVFTLDYVCYLNPLCVYVQWEVLCVSVASLVFFSLIRFGFSWPFSFVLILFYISYTSLWFQHLLF